MARKQEAFSTKNYSVEANYQALEDLIQNNPDLWSDKYLLGTGAQLLRVIAAGQSANGVRTLQALYETFIGFMQRKDSILGYGETMGYSAFRGSNDILTIKAIANDTLVIPARTVIGNVQDIDLISTEPIIANAGQLITFNAKVGNLKSESRSIVDPEYRYIRFLSKNISNDVVLYVNDEPVNYVEAYKDAFNVINPPDSAYVLLSNAYESVDLFILTRKNTNTDSSVDEEDIIIDIDTNATLDATDVYTINYVEYSDIEYTENDVVFDYGIIQSVVEAEAGEPPQGVESLRACIPYFRDTQRAILANRDPMKVLRLLMPNVESTSGTNLNSVHSLLTYKYEDFHLVPDALLKDYEQELIPTYYFGFCPSNIMHPVRYNTTLNVEIVVFSPEVEEVDIKEELDRILHQYEMLPQPSSMNFTLPINLNDIESELNKYELDNEPIVKTAYVTLMSNAITPGTIVKLGEFYEEDNTIYRATDFTYASGDVLPASYNDDYTPCGEILLEKWRLIWGAQELQPNIYYTPDTIVKISDTENFRVHPLYYLPETPYVYSNWCSITYGNKGYIALSTDGYTSISTDGLDWSEPIQIKDLNWNSINYGAQLYVALGDNGFISTSSDGEEWALPIQKGTANWNSMAYGNGIYAIVGSDGNVSYSRTGSSWANPQQIGTENWNSIVFTGEGFVAVGDNGAIGYSDDGINWQEPQQVGTNNWYSITFNSNIGCVAVGSDGYTVESTNGMLWTTPLKIGNTTWNSVTYFNNMYTAVGSHGSIAYSSDGINWGTPDDAEEGSISEQALLATWRSTISDGNTIVVVGDSGYIMQAERTAIWSEPFTVKVGGWSTTIGDLIYTNDMIWLVVEYTTGTTYVPHSYAIKGMIVTPEGSSVSYQLIGFYKTVDSIKPEKITHTYTHYMVRLIDGTLTNKFYTQDHETLYYDNLKIEDVPSAAVEDVYDPIKTFLEAIGKDIESSDSITIIGENEDTVTTFPNGVVVEEFPEGLETRKIYNLWNSYTVLSTGNLNIHV